MSYQSLKGTMVIDLGIITAGASTSTILADLGAEVIKVEGPKYIDPFRYWSSETNSEAWWEESQPFILTNRGKRSVCINLKSEGGRAVFLDLVRIADVVVENFRAGVLETLGISYETLRSVNERIVLISISSQGQTGPEARAVSFGSTLEGSSGMASLIHYDNGPPQISGHALNYPDQVVSLFAAGTALCALAHREKSSSGSYIDLSQRELATFMLGDQMMATLDRSPVAPSPTNSGIQTVTQTSDGRWVAVHFKDGKTARRFAVAASDEDDLVRSIESALARLILSDALALVQRAGGKAVLVRTCVDLLSEGSAGRSSHALIRDVEGHSVKGFPWRVGSNLLSPPRATVPLGFDNEAIIVGRLGYSRSEYERLVQSGIVASKPDS